MKIKIIGCAPVFSSGLCYNCSGYLVDSQVLFDCGPGVFSGFRRMSQSLLDVHTICLSHFHVDHVSDLPAILMARYLSPHRDERLRIFGPVGLRSWYEKLTSVAGEWSQTMNLDLRELSHPVEFSGYSLQIARTPHTDNSICFRLEDRFRRVFFYSGDTDFSDHIVESALDADLAIIECSNTDETKVPGHLTPALAAQLAKHAAVKHLVLTHMYPEVQQIEIHTLIRKYFYGNVSLARDGTEFNL